MTSHRFLVNHEVEASKQEVAYTDATISGLVSRS